MSKYNEKRYYNYRNSYSFWIAWLKFLLKIIVTTLEERRFLESLPILFSQTQIPANQAFDFESRSRRVEDIDERPEQFVIIFFLNYFFIIFSIFRKILVVVQWPFNSMFSFQKKKKRVNEIQVNN